MHQDDTAYRAEVATHEQTGHEAHVYRLWIWLLGLCARATRKLLLARIPHKVVSSSAKPPESYNEIEGLQLFDNIRRPARWCPCMGCCVEAERRDSRLSWYAPIGVSSFGRAFLGWFKGVPR